MAHQLIGHLNFRKPRFIAGFSFEKHSRFFKIESKYSPNILSVKSNSNSQFRYHLFDVSSLNAHNNYRCQFVVIICI